MGLVEVAYRLRAGARVGRGTPGGGGRPRLRQLKYAGKDWAVLVFFLVIAVLVGVLGHFGL